MVKPIRLKEVSAIPDILGAWRYKLMFGDIPGMGNGSLRSGRGPEALAIKCVNVNFPPFVIGQIRVPVMNHARAFRGHIDHQNRFAASFYEDSRGGTIETLWNWRKQIISEVKLLSGRQSKYSTNAEVFIFNTKGEVATKIRLTHVWMTSMTPPQLDVQNSGPALIEAEFSFDVFDVENGGGNRG